MYWRLKIRCNFLGYDTSKVFFLETPNPKKQIRLIVSSIKQVNSITFFSNLTNLLTLIINIEPSPLFQKSSISVMWRIDGAQNQLALEHIPPHFHDLCWWRFWSLLVREINGKSSNSKSVLIFFIWAFNRGVLFYFFGTRVSHCYFTWSDFALHHC